MAKLSVPKAGQVDPFSGSQVSHAASKGLHATTKDPACCNQEQRTKEIFFKGAAK